MNVKKFNSEFNKQLMREHKPFCTHWNEHAAKVMKI